MQTSYPEVNYMLAYFLPVEGWFYLMGENMIKESHLVHMVVFAVAQRIDHMPAFKWWVRHVPKKKDK